MESVHALKKTKTFYKHEEQTKQEMLSTFFNDPDKRRLRFAAAGAAALVAGWAAWRYCNSSSSGNKNSTSSSSSSAAIKMEKKPAGKIPENISKLVKITALFIHPIKSCAPVPVTSAEITALGLRHDREWAVLRCDGSRAVLTQRDLPRMCLIRATISDDEKFLEVSVPSSSSSSTSSTSTTVQVPLEVSDADKEKRTKFLVEKWNIYGQTMDEGDAAATVLSEFLGEPVRLTRIYKSREPARSPWHREIGTYKQNDLVAMQDFSSLHIISEESVNYMESLRQKEEKDTAEGGEGKKLSERIGASRFRPNVVIRGTNTTFEEDYWKRFEIRGSGNSSSVTGRVLKTTGRCQIPGVLHDGTRDSVAGGFPSATLRSTGRSAFYAHQHGKAAVLPGSPLKWPMLGLNCAHDASSVGQRISVGDEIHVLELVSAEDAVVYEK